jgi:hypothetical protein
VHKKGGKEVNQESIVEYNVGTEDIIKRKFLSKRPPFGLTTIGIEYCVNHRRIDVLAKDNFSMVVIEIKASSVADLSAVKQVLEYKDLIQKEFKKPTRVIILANRFKDKVL